MVEAIVDVLPVIESHAEESDHHRIIVIGHPPVVKVRRHPTGISPQGVIIVEVGENIRLPTSLSADSRKMFVSRNDHSREDTLKDLHRPVISRLSP